MSEPLQIISLGAGVQSSTMALMAAHGEIKPMPDAAIFADTKGEPKAIYKWLDWLEGELPFPVHRVTAGDLRADVYDSFSEDERIAAPPFFTGKKHSAPVPFRNSTGGVLRRQCTREYKIEPVTKMQRKLMGLKPRERAGDRKLISWVGISCDEAMRMKPSRERWVTNRWPLIEKDMHRHHCLEWMESHGYPKPSKSACTFCPYHSNTSWRDMKINDPASFAEAVEMDEKIRGGVRGSDNELFLHRSLKPLAEVDFRNAEDKGQLNMFNNECEGMCGV